MQELTRTSYLTKRQAKRLFSSVEELVLAMTNNTALMRAGYDLALKKPELVKRYDRRIIAAHKRVKPALTKFVAVLDDVVGCRMPWCYMGWTTREEAMAALRNPRRKRRAGKKVQGNRMR